MMPITRLDCWLLASLALSLLLAPSLTAAGADGTLARAVEVRDSASVRQLLAARVDVNAPQADGSTALLWAAHHDDLELVDQLLRAGAHVKAANRYGVAPLTSCGLGCRYSRSG